MKLQKRITALLLTFAIILGLLSIPPIQVSATEYYPGDVFGKLSSDEMADLFYVIDHPCFSIAFINYIDTHNMRGKNKTKTFDFSKASARRYIVKHIGIRCVGRNQEGGDIHESPNRISKILFNRQTKNVKVITGDTSDDVPSIGGWERSYPLIKEKGKNRYRYEKNINIYNAETGEVSMYGRASFTLKKVPSLPYTWMVLKCKINGDY